MVVALLDVAGFLAAQVGLGHAGLQVHHGRGALEDVRQARQLQHGGHMGGVLGADGGHALRGIQVVAALRQAQAALEEEGRVAVGLVQVLGHPEAEEVGRVVLGGVQHVHIGPQRRAQVVGQGLAVLDGADGAEGGLEGAEPLLVDGLFGHEAGVEVADLPQLGPRGGLGGRSGLDQGGRAPVREVRHLAPDPVRTPVCGDLRPLHPGAVGIGEEVVAGGHGAIHAREVQAVRRGLGGRRHQGGDETEGKEGQ